MIAFPLARLLPPLQGLFAFLFDYPGRCPGLSSVGLTALADEIAHTAVPHGGIRFGTNELMQTALGICGEHGGEPDSVKFCHRIGLNYVSCSPFRVPVARLAAAQAAIEEKRKAAKPEKKK